MGLGRYNLDRLLPRHEPRDRVRLDWNLRTVKRGLRKKEERYDAGDVVDMSLEGALIEVADDHEHEIGDEIVLRFNGLKSVAEIRHRREGDTGKLLYGVRFRPGPEFRRAVETAVGELRGNREKLEEAWNREN